MSKSFYQVIQWSSKNFIYVFADAHSFNSAMKDIKQYFSRGLCCQPTAITKQYNVRMAAFLLRVVKLYSWMGTNFHLQIPCPLCDDNGNIAAMGHLCPPDGKTPNSPLLETTCIILPPLFFQQHDKSQPSFISALELVSQAGFDVLGLRMVFFSEELATTLCHCFSEEYKVLVCKSGMLHTRTFSFPSIGCIKCGWAINSRAQRHLIVIWACIEASLFWLQ